MLINVSCIKFTRDVIYFTENFDTLHPTLLCNMNSQRKLTVEITTTRRTRYYLIVVFQRSRAWSQEMQSLEENMYAYKIYFPRI